MSTPRERAERAAGGQVPLQVLDEYQQVGRDLLAALDRMEELEGKFDSYRRHREIVEGLPPGTLASASRLTDRDPGDEQPERRIA